MRPLKFRQWKNRKFHFFGFIKVEEWIGPIPPLIEAHENTEQFTGLLDKNGKEIYEGDLVNVSMHVPGRLPLGIKKVMFSSGSFGLFDADNIGDFMYLWGGQEVVGGSGRKEAARGLPGAQGIRQQICLPEVL